MYSGMVGMRFLGILTSLLCWGGATSVFGQPATCPPDHVGCFAEDAEWLWEDTLVDTIDFDSGWVPASSPVQLRLTFHLAGATMIAMEGTPTVTWPPPLEVRVPGREGTGLFLIDYGMEVRAWFRFDVEVAGVRYTFENEIDIPVLPMDLRFYDELSFDPFLLPDAEPARMADRTEPIPIVNLDLADFVGIPGVSGGLRLDVQGDLGASYRTTALVVQDAAPILEEMGATVARPDPGEAEFGASKDLWIHPEGVLDYEGAVVFSPTLFLDVAGRGFGFPLSEIPFDLVALSREVVFDDVRVHVPLPDIDVATTEVDFGEVPVGASASRLLRIDNRGEAILDVDLAAVEGFEADRTHLEVPPAASASVELTFTPTEPGRVSAAMWIASNDPDESMVLIRLAGTGLAMPMDDAGWSDAGVDGGAELVDGGGGCGCRTTEGAPAASLWLLVLWVASRRRAWVAHL